MDSKKLKYSPGISCRRKEKAEAQTNQRKTCVLGRDLQHQSILHGRLELRQWVGLVMAGPHFNPVYLVMHNSGLYLKLNFVQDPKGECGEVVSLDRFVFLIWPQ